MAKDPGNSFSKAQSIGLLGEKSTFRNAVSNSDKFDVYRFSLSRSSNLRGVLNGLQNNADLVLFNSDRQRIAISNKSGRTADSLNAVLEAGDYFIRVDQKAGTTNYRLNLSTTPFFFAGVADETTTAARAITLGTTAVSFDDSVGTGATGATDAADFYSFSTSAFGNLSLNLSKLETNANVQILNSAGAVVRSAIASGTTTDVLNTGLDAGSYFVRVFPGAGGSATNYNLSLSLTPLKMVGLADNNTLVSFTSANVTTAASTVAVTGVDGALRGIDYRPADGRLYGITTNSIYTIDPTTGAATRVGAGNAFSLSTDIGIDFNPTVDRLRVVDANDQDLRLNPDTGGIAGTDTPLAYASTDINSGQNPSVVGSAYTNNFAGATSTTLYSIDSTGDRLVTQGGLNGAPSPNGGQLFTVGSLGAGVNFGSSVGFDIFTDANRTTNAAFAVSGSSLFGINLTTGAATNLGTVSAAGTPVNLIGLAIGA